MSAAIPAYLLPLLHFAALAGLGAFARSRLLVLVAATAGGVWLALVSQPADLASTSVADLAMTFGGVALGAIVGLWAAGAHERRARAERIAREVASGRQAPKREPRSGPGALAWVGGLVVVALVAAVGLYVEGSTVPAWRATVDGWRQTPTARSLGLAPAPVAPAAAKSGSSGTPTGARAGQGDRRATGTGGPGARPQGDLRHCLEQGGTQDVLRCADGRR